MFSKKQSALNGVRKRKSSLMNEKKKIVRIVTTRNSHITWKFSCKFDKKICKKKLFPTIFSKNFNWRIIPSWVIISYKIIKFANISYKIYCEKCFIQNILKNNRK